MAATCTFWVRGEVVSVGEREKRVPLLRHAHAYKIPVTMPRHYELSLIDLRHWRFCSSITARTRLQNTGHHASALQAVTNRSETLALLFLYYGMHTVTKYWSPWLALRAVTNRSDPPVVASSISIIIITNNQCNKNKLILPRDCSSSWLFPKIESINRGRVASELWSDDYLTSYILTNGYVQWRQWNRNVTGAWC